MFQTNVQCYLWDLVDEGIDEVLDRLQGEVGITGLSVATCCPPIDQLRPHAGVSPRVFRSAGGVQFQPSVSTYHSTRMRPVVAAWLKKSNPIASLAQACEKRNLILRAWIVCCRNPATVSRYQGNAVKNALDDVNPFWLCPVNPDVREYLRAIVEDLSEHYSFETIELEDIGFPTLNQGAAAFQTGLCLGEVGAWLMDLCFCESCRQAASRDGIDAELAARTAKETLEKLFAAGEPCDVSASEWAANQPPIADYARWRCRQITQLVQETKQACRCRLVVYRKGTPLREATDFAALATQCDALLVPCPDLQHDKLESSICSASQETGNVNRVELGITARAPTCPDSATLVRFVSEAARQGIRRINVANFGLVPEPRLEWIKQAARYAQRQCRQ